MATVKETVKEFYKKANEKKWYKFLIYPNELKAYGVDRCVSYDPKEDCPAGSYRGFYNGAVLKHQNLCDEMTADEKNTLISLGFQLKPQCFWCRRPDGSATGFNNCHILYAGRELTADELWLTDIKQRAIDLGYDIRDCGWIADCHIGWGFWGATITDAWNALSGFAKETGVTYAGASIIKNFQSGHLYVINSFYAYGLYAITEPICPEGKHEILELCPDGIMEKRWRDCINGKWVEDSQSCPECYPEGKHEVLEMCPDDVTEKRWRDCITGNWVYNAQTCPECYPEGKYETLELCPDGVTVKRWRECINGNWVVHIDQCPECYPEGKEIILETCPDGTTVKRWKTCINGEWVEDSRECPEAPPAPPCPIMCITMGTPLVDCLGPLRVFRDKVLKRTAPGRWFVSFYYDRLTPVLSPVILKIRRKKNVP